MMDTLRPNIGHILFLIFYCASAFSQLVPSDRSLSATSCFQMSAGPSLVSLKTEVPAAGQVCIDVPDIPADVRFILLEAHTHRVNVTLSYINSSSPLGGNAVTGTGVGLVSMVEGPRFETFWLFNSDEKDVVSALITLVSYAENDPIPGGCNIEFPVEISPFLRITYNKANTRLEFQHAQLGYPAGQPPMPCSTATNFVSYQIYLYFLPEQDLTEDSYFRGMTLMRDVASVKRNGVQVKPYAVSPRTRAIFFAYPGQGVIYNIIAQTTENGTIHEAAYAPLASYGCTFDSSLDGCRRITGPFGKVLALVLAVFGLFLTIRGHRYLTIEMAYFGFLTGSLITFVLLARYSSVIDTDRDVLTVTGGVVMALLWGGLWWFLGIPVLSVCLVGFVLGFLLTSVVYFTPLGDADVFRNDFNYWMILACGMLATPVLLLPTTRMLNILGSSIVGSYFVVVVVDRFTGTSLSSIVLNVVKRAVVEDTGLASNEFPFQRNDIILSSVWVALSLFGTCLQRFFERHRAPFPPAPYKAWRREWQRRSERRRATRMNSQLTQQNSGSVEDAERAPLLASYDNTTPGHTNRSYS